ncbi:EXS domain containing protein [Spraguea lophii 42_110]|uniref:EXS domain containing protein n=1 Tax=Spraguea lophii (strain 42_110) TaxID=1358809 RepID=S7W7R6_SPRLO|nr:EXS domain containing protein [Spraguea lophii 42_110]
MGFYKHFEKNKFTSWNKSGVNYKHMCKMAAKDKKKFIKHLINNISELNKHFLLRLNTCLKIFMNNSNSNTIEIKEDSLFTNKRLMIMKNIYLKIYSDLPLTWREKKIYKKIFVEQKLEQKNIGKSEKPQKKNIFSSNIKEYGDQIIRLKNEPNYLLNVSELKCSNYKKNLDEKRNQEIIDTPHRRIKFLREIDIELKKYFIEIDKNKESKSRIIFFMKTLNDLVYFQSINKKIILNLLKIHNKSCENDIFSPRIFPGDIKYILSKIMFSTSQIPNIILKRAKKFYARTFINNGEDDTDGRIDRIFQRKNPNPFKVYVAGGISTISFIMLIQEVSKNITTKLFQLFWNVQYILIGFWLFGLLMAILEKYKIDYGFLFECNIASKSTPYTHILIFSIFLLYNNIIYYILSHFKQHTDYLYCGMICFTIAVILLPFQSFWPTRMYFYNIVGKQFTTPFYKVKFKYYILTSIMASYSGCFRNLYLVYFNDETLGVFIITALPFVIRLIQCYRKIYDGANYIIHAINSIKYVLSICTIGFFLLRNVSKTLKYAGAILFGITTIFNIIWDFEMGWNIRRKTKIFPIFWYVIIGIYTIPVRCIWILPYFNILTKYFWPMVILGAEIFRRFLWALIRIELEYLNSNKTLNKSRPSILRSENISNTTNKDKRDVLGLDAQSGVLKEVIIRS